MEEKARIKKICSLLKKAYPEVKTQLEYGSAFQLLIATILSAQCTDRQVNLVVRKLFKRLSTPLDFVNVPIEELEAAIRPTGYYKNKAKSIKGCSAAILERHNGEVPRRLEDLVKLPGVGRKTANVVLGAVFGVPGIVVDTHVKRISVRLGLTDQKDPVKIEFDLMGKIPKEDWNDFSLHLIYFGRSICKARKPGCRECFLLDLCPYEDKAM